MGFYIETPVNKGKADWLVEHVEGAKQVGKAEAEKAVSTGLGVIVVVDNKIFEAAGFAYNEDEFRAFNDPNDLRVKRYVVMDREDAELMSGYSR